MQLPILVTILLVLTAAGYYWGRQRSLAVGNGSARHLHSLPSYYGALVALWCGIPALVVLGLWLAFDSVIITALLIDQLPPEIQSLPQERLSLVVNDIKNLAAGGIVSEEVNPTMQAAAEHYLRLQRISFAAMVVVVLALAMGGLTVGRRIISPRLRARYYVEQTIMVLLILCSTIAILTTIGIVLSVLFEALRFFQTIPVSEFLLGLQWSPQIAIREGQVGGTGMFGAVPLFAGTLLIAAIAMVVAIPTGLLSAIYLSEYASPRFRGTAKPIVEILAGIPTVVYGFFAAITVAPLIRDLGTDIGLEVSSQSALAAGLVMGIMIIPFVSSLSDDVINAVPQSMRDGSYALGATPSETVKKVILTAALPGIVGGILLAVSRAIGETMIVVMAAGLAANLTANPLEAVTTVTVQIVSLLTGDQEFDSPKTLAAFALGLTLFVATLLLNVLALYIVRKYREQYE